MVEIQITAYQCDFCGIRDLSLPTCVVCGKHLCKKHRKIIDFGVFEIQVRNERVTSVFKEERYLCPVCTGKRADVYLKLAAELIAEAEKIPEEEPPLEEPKL